MAKSERHIFNKLNAIHKLIISGIIAAIIYLIIPFKNATTLIHIIFSWDIFSLCLLTLSWITFYTTPPPKIRKQAQRQDDTRVVIFTLVLLATCVSMLAVILILTSKDASTMDKAYRLPVAMSCMLLSWFLVHTIFTTRYAHIYYADHKIKKDTAAGGLDFPEEDHPDFLDFAYFSFTLGMTFQVSDVDISSKSIRRLALWHGLISFGYNTTIIALGVNIVAGLIQG